MPIMKELTGLDLIVSEDIKSDLVDNMTRVELLEVQLKNGEKVPFETYVNDFTAELSKKNENEEFTKVFKCKDANFTYTPTQEKIKIQGFKLTGHLKIAKSKMEIKGEDHVWLIMKSIFEDKTYTISKDGKIKKRED